jgi:hypothetical protein
MSSLYDKGRVWDSPKLSGERCTSRAAALSPPRQKNRNTVCKTIRGRAILYLPTELAVCYLGPNDLFSGSGPALKGQCHAMNILFKVLSQPIGPETDKSQAGIEPGPPQWEASTLAKTNSELVAIRTIYI